MPRGRPPFKQSVVKKEIKITENKVKEIVEEVQEDLKSTEEEIENDLVELTHWISNGCISIGETIYKIVNGKVKVKPDHVIEVKNHIDTGR
jgi:actin-like ATPase involved in cell morphogenesis